MPIQKLNPHTIWLGGSIEVLDDREFPASAAITPGMLVEMFDNAGSPNFRAQSSSAAEVARSVALDREEFNKTIDDPYAIGDTVKVGYLNAGSTFYGLVPSGETVNKGDMLQSNGDGTLVAAGGYAPFQSLDDLGATTVLTRCRTQILA